ncbi:MAG: hypothetical protein MI784_01475 [Cytophagales bacterium]|nr:hypothetical protein [Cytophagales bacterium]
MAKRSLSILLLFFGLNLSGFSESAPADSLKHLTAYESFVFGNLNRGIENSLDLLLAPDRSLSGTVSHRYKKRIKEHLLYLKEKREKYKNENQFFRFVFFSTKSTFLKQYAPYVSLGETIRNGVYDCVTGTSLYAFFFEKLGCPTEIIETDHHVFLLVEGKIKRYLVESTLPDGITNNAYTIRKVFKRYTRKRSSASMLQGIGARPNQHAAHGKIIGRINLKQLSALQYFNLALAAALQNDKTYALCQLRKSQVLYPSKRSQVLKRHLTF